MQRLVRGVRNIKTRTKTGLFIQEGKVTVCMTNEDDGDKQMKYRINTDNQNESEV